MTIFWGRLRLLVIFLAEFAKTITKLLLTLFKRLFRVNMVVIWWNGLVAWSLNLVVAPSVWLVLINDYRSCATYIIRQISLLKFNLSIPARLNILVSICFSIVLLFFLVKFLGYLVTWFLWKLWLTCLRELKLHQVSGILVCQKFLPP